MHVDILLLFLLASILFFILSYSAKQKTGYPNAENAEECSIACSSRCCSVWDEVGKTCIRGQQNSAGRCTIMLSPWPLAFMIFGIAMFNVFIFLLFYELARKRNT